MTLDQLRMFVAVAERQHLTRAAAALNHAQSAVSAAIAALEGRYGVKLFDRVGRRIELTDAGRSFLVEARTVLARAEAAEQTLAELGGLKRGRLRLQASQTISSYWLPRHLVAYHRAFPNIDLELGVGNTAQVAKAVLDGVAELGFVEGRVDDAQLRSRTVARDQLVIVVSPSHPWAACGRVAAADLIASQWVMRERGSGTRSMFEEAAQSYGILSDLSIALELPSNEAVRGAVEVGLGAAALSAAVAAPSIEAGLLAKVEMTLPEREFHVVHHRERQPSRAAEALIDLIQKGRHS